MYKVYYLVSDTTAYYYIGMTKNSLPHRMKQHEYAARAGKKSPLYTCMRKHKFAISLQEEFLTKDECCSKERELIENARTMKHKLLNLADGGEGGFVVPDHKQEEWRQKLRTSRKGRRPFYKHNHTEATKQLCREAVKKRWKDKTYPEDVTNLSFKEANQKYGISKTHYYRKRAEANDLS